MGKKKTKKKLSKRQARKRELKRLHRELVGELKEERALIAKIKERDPKTELREDTLADKIDAARGQISRLKDRIESVEARQLKLKRVIARLKKRLHRLRQRARRRKYYASPHFRYEEFDCRDGTKVPESSKEGLRHLCANYLEPLRAKYGAVYPNSGFRTRAYNARIGGAYYSQHIYNETPKGVAVDHICSGANPNQVFTFLATKGPGGLGSYPSFTHVDNRQREGKPTARWSG